eukprot:COSAG02_NODE_2067_length_9945_cov_24.620150_3_plen_94_part_00
MRQHGGSLADNVLVLMLSFDQPIPTIDVKKLPIAAAETLIPPSPLTRALVIAPIPSTDASISIGAVMPESEVCTVRHACGRAVGTGTMQLPTT